MFKQSTALSPVVLMGETIGSATIGIIYLASFLKKRHVWETLDFYYKVKEIDKKKYSDNSAKSASSSARRKYCSIFERL